MTFAIGGSAKLRRIVKEAPRDWVCACKHRDGNSLAFTWRANRGYLAKCTNCGTRRPG